MMSPPRQLVGMYGFACAYRVINALLIQTQFDADEYWQCLEPAYCLAFASDQRECAYTWEWTRRLEEDVGGTPYAWLQRALHGPVRSFLPVMPTYALYMVAKWFGVDTPWMISRGPLVLNAILVAAPTDVATVYIADWLNRDPKQSSCAQSIQLVGKGKIGNISLIGWWALVASISSWFNGYALVRTYSNSMEAMLLSLGICLLAPDLFTRDTEDYHIRPLSALAFILGGLSICVRFTAVAAWIPLGIICSSQRRTLTGKVFALFALCGGFGLLGVMLGTLLDRVMYGFWAMPFLGSFHFNALQGNGSLYGTHHPLWYIFAGLPAICGALLPFFLYEVVTIFKEERTDANHEPTRARKTLIIVIASYVLLHSFSAHKEFRFLLPILPLVFALAAHCFAYHYTPWIERFGRSHDERSGNCVRSVLCNRLALCYFPLFLLNYPHLFFLARTHQAASIGVNKEIVRHIQCTNAREENTEYTIHYLMGCHSTPLYSHLHVPGIGIRATTLDCSPYCRARGNCESDIFQSDPLSYLDKAYKKSEAVPSFLVIFEDDLDPKVAQKIADIGLVQVEKIRHEIDSCDVSLALGTFDVLFRHMVLFKKKID